VTHEHDDEPVHGLPGKLPAGEAILWQGAPVWERLAVEALHLRAVAIYFLGLVVWQTGDGLTSGAPLLEALGASWAIGAAGLAAAALIAGLAILIARTTVYTITSRRIVLRIGVAFSKAINVPFAVIDKADLKAFSGGAGDLAVHVRAPHRVAALYLWPHLRPWRLANPEPMLRAVPDAAKVADILSAALLAAAPDAVRTPAHAGDHEPRVNSLGGPARPAAA
jgi:hypothetical protein